MTIKLSDFKEKLWASAWFRLHNNIYVNENQCWIWKKAKTNFGYGNIGAFRKGKKSFNIRTHRLSWLLYNGEIDNNLFILHKCDQRDCCNPNHLFLGTQKENVKDMILKGRGSGRADKNRKKTHCVNGHEFNKENTIKKNGKRNCRICQKEYGASFSKRKKDTLNFKIKNNKISKSKTKIFLVENNKKLSLLEIAKKYGFKYQTLFVRYQAGHRFPDIITPLKRSR